MTRRLLVRAMFLTVLAAGAAVRPAHAQCRLCAKPSTALANEEGTGDVTLEIETGLDFDRLILFGQGDGTATLRPDGSNGADGAIGELGPRAMVGSASVHGEANRLVRVELPHRIELYSTGGGWISLDDVISDLPSQPRLDGAGNLTFRFGGRVRITGDADGRYRGDLPITVEYL